MQGDRIPSAGVLEFHDQVKIHLSPSQKTPYRR